MELAGKHDIVIEQGAGFALPLTFTADGTPVDFTGSTAKMQIREKTGSSVVLVELSTANSRITLAADGTLEATLTAEVTAGLKFSDAVYDLEITPMSGEPYRLLEGRVFLDREVTRG